MAKVKVKVSFVGTPDEMEKYSGEVSNTMKHVEHRMTEGERASYNGKINPGTEMEVSDKRAAELLDLGLIEGDKPKEEKVAKEKKDFIGTGVVKEKKTSITQTPKAKKK
jgi:hypothetical protein